MDRDKIIALLNEDVEGEHGAIIQYLTHAYAMGEGEMACEIEAIAREEMRHLDWLAEPIVELGGVPSLKRGKMRMGGKGVPDWMGNNVRLEEDAISLYKKHIKLINDPKIKRLLGRILSDEESHRGGFEHLVSKTDKKGAQDIRGARNDKVAKFINWGIEHEYTVILQYLFHSYMTANREAKNEWQDQAINEMQHLGWLAEKMIDLKSSPRIEHTEVDQSIKTADMLKVDINIEKEVAAEYARGAKETKNLSLKELFGRLRDHEIYHAELFTDLLKKRPRR
ncbi:MAG: ferritin-like domain-containing protein [Dehalococcoidales bacterium]|nr:ferritin-like domain-containing protein [Dehalococcoidales bacterium]